MITCENCPVNQRCCSNVHTRTNQNDLEKILLIGNEAYHHIELENIDANQALKHFINIISNLPQYGAHYYHIGDGTIRLSIIGPCRALNQKTGKCDVHETDMLPSFCKVTQVGDDICRP